MFLMPHAEETALFMDSLVTNVTRTPSLRLLHAPQDVEPSSSFGVEGASKYLIAPTTAAASTLRPATVMLPRPPRPEQTMYKKSWSTATDRIEYPLNADLIDFVLAAWAQKTGIPACVRAWSHVPEQRMMTLALAQSNRWCEHVQRQHRSNGIFLRVDLCQASFSQYCYDPDCRAAGFRGSSAVPIPRHLCERDAAHNFQGGYDDDDAMLAALPLDDILAAYNEFNDGPYDRLRQ